MFLKDPDSALDYEVDWSAVFPASAIFQSSIWLVEPQHAAGLSVISSGISARVMTVRLAGGVCGMLYRVTNRISLTDGYTDERSLVIRVEER